MHPVGAGHARPAAYRHILFTIQSAGEGFIPPGHPPTAANGHGGQRAGRPTPPHIKPVRRAGCPHPAETCRHIPFPRRRPVGAGHARPAAYRHIFFTIQSVGEEFIPPAHLPATADGRGGQRAGRPTPPTSNPCVGRGALTPPKPAAPYMHHLYISLNLFIFL